MLASASFTRSVNLRTSVLLDRVQKSILQLEGTLSDQDLVDLTNSCFFPMTSFLRYEMLRSIRPEMYNNLDLDL